MKTLKTNKSNKQRRLGGISILITALICLPLQVSLLKSSSTSSPSTQNKFSKIGAYVLSAGLLLESSAFAQGGGQGGGCGGCGAGGGQGGGEGGGGEGLQAAATLLALAAGIVGPIMDFAARSTEAKEETKRTLQSEQMRQQGQTDRLIKSQQVTLALASQQKAIADQNAAITQEVAAQQIQQTQQQQQLEMQIAYAQTQAAQQEAERVRAFQREQSEASIAATQAAADARVAAAQAELDQTLVLQGLSNGLSNNGTTAGSSITVGNGSDSGNILVQDATGGVSSVPVSGLGFNSSNRSGRALTQTRAVTNQNLGITNSITNSSRTTVGNRSLASIPSSGSQTVKAKSSYESLAKKGTVNTQSNTSGRLLAAVRSGNAKSATRGITNQARLAGIGGSLNRFSAKINGILTTSPTNSRGLKAALNRSRGLVGGSTNRQRVRNQKTNSDLVVFRGFLKSGLNADNGGRAHRVRRGLASQRKGGQHHGSRAKSRKLTNRRPAGR